MGFNKAKTTEEVIEAYKEFDKLSNKVQELTDKINCIKSMISDNKLGFVKVSTGDRFYGVKDVYQKIDSVNAKQLVEEYSKVIESLDTYPIYTKIIDLRDEYGEMPIVVGVNGSNVTTSVGDYVTFGEEIVEATKCNNVCVESKVEELQEEINKIKKEGVFKNDPMQVLPEHILNFGDLSPEELKIAMHKAFSGGSTGLSI